MAEKRVNVRVGDYELETLDAIAAEVWPESAGNRSELGRKIWVDWRRQREEDGGKSGRTRKLIDELMQVCVAHTAILQQIDARLAAIEQTQKDTIRPLVKANGHETTAQ